jgi:hypothetical protein
MSEGEDILKQPESKSELEDELAKLQREIGDVHEILDRLGSDSRNIKPRAEEEAEHRLPARLNRYVQENHGAVLKLLSHCSTGGTRG